jgi:hypothetical protein
VYFAIGALAATSATNARAQSKGDDMPDFMRVPVQTERRHGFTFGVTAAPAMVWSRATPNEYEKRNDRYAVRFDHAVVTTGTLFLGVAFADELSFAFQLEPSFARHGNVKVSGFAFAFRVETFPFVSLGGIYRDLGIAPRFGLGTASFKRKSTGESLATSSLYSLVGVDVFWDALRHGHFGLGPTLGIAHRFSETYRWTEVTLGVRVAFYGGP